MMQRLKIWRPQWCHVLASSSLKVLLTGLFGLNYSISVAYASPAYVYPLMGPRLSSEYGSRQHPIYKSKKHHEGVDLAAPDGAPIRSIQSGVVVFADTYAGYGKLIVVRHASGLTSHYGHCSVIHARPGQKVLAGEIIGLVGSTGKVTGAHLHFEIRMGGRSQDPETFLPGLASNAAG